MRSSRQVIGALFRSPWYTTSIVAVITIGFAILTSVLAVVEGVLFSSLGYPGGNQLVAIRLSSSLGKGRPTITPDDVTSWAGAVPGVAFTGFLVFPVESTGRALVQPNFFDVIGMRPAIGGFAATDFEAASGIEARVVSEESFASQEGGDRNAIGRVVVTDTSTGSGYRIVGVMQRGFVFPSDWWPVSYLTPYVAGRPFSYLHHVVARMPPGMTTQDLRARLLAAIAAKRGADVSRIDPANPPIDQVEVQPLRRALGAASRPLFGAFLAASGLLLVVAVINASGLMAARSLNRARELAVRRALGATPWHIAWLLLIEASILISAGAAIGTVVAVPLLRLIVPLLPEGLVLLRVAAIDWSVLAVVVTVAVSLTGLATALLLWQVMAGDARLEAARHVTEPARSTRSRLLVAAQVALAVVLTVAGSLLVGSLLTIYVDAPPITTKGIITIRARFLGRSPVNQVARVVPERAIRVNALLERLRSVPGVDAAAVVAADFLNGGRTPSWFSPPAGASPARLPVETHAVTADYYRVLEPHVVAGRLPTAAELQADAPVLVVGERVAGHFWPNAPAIGQTLTDSQLGLTFTVVGVIKDVRWFSWDAAPCACLYGPYALLTRMPAPTFLIRASGNTSRVSANAVRVLGDADPMLRTQRPALLEDLFVDSVRPRRLIAWLFGAFGAASLLVVAVGTLGYSAMSTARRVREVGIRMACGATPVGVVRLILGEQVVPVLIGLIAGAIGAAWAVRFVRSRLYQLTSFDPTVWGIAIGMILLTAAIGALIPALRTTRIDPVQSLRAD